MRLTLKMTNELCEEMWQWCIDNSKGKYEWPRWKSNGGDIEDTAGHKCFYCMYGQQQYNHYHVQLGKRAMHGMCNYCPYYRAYGYGCTDPKGPWSGAYPDGYDHKKFLEQVKFVHKGGTKLYRQGKKKRN